MKKLISLIGLLLIALAVYTGYWFSVANKAEERFIQALNSWRSEQGGKADITYAHLKKSGYPFLVGLTITNPHFLSPGNADASLEGNVRISLPFLFGREAAIKADGAFKAEYSNFDIQHQLHWQGNIVLKQRADNPQAHFAQLKRLVEDSLYGEPNIPEDCEIHTALQNINYKSLSGIEELSSFESGSANIDIAKTGTEHSQQNVSYNIDLQGLDVKIERLFSDGTLVDAIYKHTTFVLSTPTNVQLIGKLSFPPLSEWDTIATEINKSQNASLSVEIEKFSLDNDLYSETIKDFAFSLQQQMHQFKVIYRGKTEGTVTALYDEKMAEAMTGFLKSPGFLNEMFPKQPKMQQRLTKAIPAIIKLSPQIHLWGKIIREFDLMTVIEAGEDAEGTPVVLDATFKPIFFKFQMSPYTVQFSGELSKENKNGTLTIRNYQQLIKELVSYNNRVAKVMKELKIKSLQNWPLFNEQQTEKVVAFLMLLDGEAGEENPNLSIEAVYSEGGLKIGKLSLAEVTAKGIELLSQLQSAL